MSKDGLRLDRFLSEKFRDLSRNRIQSLICSGNVICSDAGTLLPKRKVNVGEKYYLTIPETLSFHLKAQDIPIEIIYEDECIAVVNKPSGLIVHPGAGNPDNTLVNAMLAHCGDTLTGVGGVERPGIVHRLDKDTSGLIVIAKNDKAHASLTRQFAIRSIKRGYRALVWGVPKSKTGKIVSNVGRHKKNRKKMAVLVEGGKEAITHYTVERTFNNYGALLHCRLETGRTHQIRVHLASIGHPVMGDPLYGNKCTFIFPNQQSKVLLTECKGQLLHAYLLGIIHPETGEKICWTVDFPSDFKDLIKSFGEA